MQMPLRQGSVTFHVLVDNPQDEPPAVLEWRPVAIELQCSPVERNAYIAAFAEDLAEWLGFKAKALPVGLSALLAYSAFSVDYYGECDETEMIEAVEPVALPELRGTYDVLRNRVEERSYQHHQQMREDLARWEAEAATEEAETPYYDPDVETDHTGQVIR